MTSDSTQPEPSPNDPNEMQEAALASLRKAAAKNPKAAAALRALETGQGRNKVRQQLWQSIRRGR